MQSNTMAEQGRNAGVYFLVGTLIGGLLGLVTGIVLHQEFRPPVFWFAAGGALLFGILGVVFKDDLLHFIPWLQ
jgi:hypothetical protein